MHDHQSEVVSERICYEEPLAGEVLEPDLRLALLLFVYKRQSSVLDLRVDVKCSNVLATNIFINLSLFANLLVRLTFLLARFTRRQMSHLHRRDLRI